MQGVAFYLLATVAVVSALLVVSARNPVHSVLWLILSFFSSAGLFVLLGAEFLAMLLVVVYVGAVAVLFLFVVMLVGVDTSESLADTLRSHRVASTIAAIGIGAMLVVAVGHAVTVGNIGTDAAVGLERANAAHGDNVHSLAVLIFTQYKAFGALLQPYLSERLGEPVPFLHGGVSKDARDAMVDSFQSVGGPRAMLLSLKAGGTGLNLTAASVVIHLDRWWNPAVENQATDRAYRIGQDKNVTVYKMITRGTLEESIQDVLDGKMHLAGTVVGEGEGWITELDTEDLARLMSYRAEEG